MHEQDEEMLPVDDEERQEQQALWEVAKMTGVDDANPQSHTAVPLSETAVDSAAKVRRVETESQQRNGEVRCEVGFVARYRNQSR